MARQKQRSFSKVKVPAPCFSGAERFKAGRAFQRFDRPGCVTGSGLGLAIAMELTRRMGGGMRFLTAEGGTAMELRLPCPWKRQLRKN